MQFWASVKKTLNAYKYRFVPWISTNIVPRKNVPLVDRKCISDEKVQEQLLAIFSRFDTLPCSDLNSALEDIAGFQLERHISRIPDAGIGVFITKGKVDSGQVVALYPGTVYLPSDFIFFQSISNSFVFRCFDHIHIDGKNTGLSKMVYKSCAQRDRIGFNNVCDTSWYTDQLISPLNVGQYVNNKSKPFSSNVQYQEFDFLHDFPLELWKYIPNINVGGLENPKFIRTVVLVATRDIHSGDEVLSDYFTMHN